MANWDTEGNDIPLAAPNANVLGTLTSDPLRIKTNGKERMIFDSDGTIRIKFEDGESGERMTILADGEVGIGKEIPEAKLDVKGTVKAQTVNAQTINAGEYQDLNGNPLQISQWTGAVGADISYSDGDVGIGTTEPGAKLDVAGAVKANELQVKETVNAKTVDATDYKKNGSPLQTSPSQWSGTVGGPISYSGGNVGIGTAGPSTTRLHVRASETEVGRFESTGTEASLQLFTKEGPDKRVGIANRPGGGLSLFTQGGDGDAINITRDGKVGIGKTAREDKLEVDGNVMIGDKIALFADGGAFKPEGGSWGDISDIRLKKGVTTLKGALEKLSRLRGVSFEWKEPENHGNLRGRRMGLIAQEVEEVFPQWIDTVPSGYKILTTRGFEALVVEALKELKADNETLKAHNDEWRSQIDKLRSQLDKVRSQLEALESSYGG